MNECDNFFNLLNNNDISYDNINYDNICLISYDTLDKNHICLPCNHKFNYINLYNEIYQQKKINNKIFNLKTNEISCPYCRTVHQCLLPHYKYLNEKKTNGVDSPDKYNILYIKNNFNKCCIKNCKNYAFNINNMNNKCNNHCYYNINDLSYINSDEFIDKYNELMHYNVNYIKELYNVKKSINSKEKLIYHILLNKL
tara:strand:- start:297 stop:890 length:594 start_codon:yes stop_codon:yes gene_type:complete